jgi:uncharacterized membrane protein
MLRGHATAKEIGAERDFRWRGAEVSRVEGLSDAVFAFAVTLLVVSLEVPRTFDDLLVTMRGFAAFAICFALLMQVWYAHYRFFRRYGLQDRYTVTLNALLLFLVLFYVYPLKFLFTLLVDQTLGVARADTIRETQVPLLMAIYGAGFLAVQLVFALLYAHAYRQRAALALDAQEVAVTRGDLRATGVSMGVALLSIALAARGGAEAGGWAGLTYLLLGPAQALNGTLTGRRVRRLRVAGLASAGAGPHPSRSDMQASGDAPPT